MHDILKVALLLNPAFEYDRGIMRGIAHYFNLHGGWQLYRELGFSSTSVSLKGRLSWLKKWNPSGIIVRESEMLEDLIAWDLPLIVLPFKSRLSHLPRIIADDHGIGKMAGKYFTDRGFQHFGFCGFDDLFWSQDIQEGFCQILLKKGIKTHIYQPPKTKSKRWGGNEQSYLIKWLRQLPKPAAILAVVDERADQLMEACYSEGLFVPDEVAILGVDNDETSCALSKIPISSLVSNTEKAGYQAATLLHRFMNGERMNAQQIIVENLHIVTRQSTNVFAINDPEVKRAVRFIHTHSNVRFGVKDVANEVAINRRHLERKFKNTMGRSIYSEIRRTRIEAVTHMLQKTNMSIAKVAAACGYESVRHMDLNLKKEKGMSALAYRKKYGVIAWTI